MAPTLFRAAPDMLRTLLDRGILLAAITAVTLNAYFNPGELPAAHAPAVVADHV